MDAGVEGLIFDLDNTLLDRQAVFLRFASDFYEERLRATISNTRDDAVAKMVEWDEDGYISREKMFARWIAEWPEVGLDVGPLERLYRSGMERQVQPDLRVNEYLVYLNEQQVPWGIVTNGSRNQRRMCRAAGLDELAPFIIVSEEAGYAKPDPRIFRDALEATGSHEAGAGYVRRGQSDGRHRRSQAIRDEGGVGPAGSGVSGRSADAGLRH